MVHISIKVQFRDQIKRMKKIAFQARDNRGAAMIGLCLALFLILTLLAFFVYDMNRMQMAQRQLTALCDSAALAGSAMLSSQDVSYEDSSEDGLYTAQTTASQYAKNMFCAGNILGAMLYDSTLSGTGIPVTLVSTSAALNSTSANQINIYIQLADPSNSFTTYQAGNSQGRAYIIQAAYGYVPSLAALGIATNLLVVAQSTAATQMMNVIMVFDCSGSMDDNTAVTFVERIWDKTYDGYNYQVVPSSGTDTKLCNYTGLNYSVAPNGTPLNVLPPQNLTDLGYLYAGQYLQWGDSATSNFYSASPPLAFDLSMRAYVATPTTSYPFSNGGVAINYTALNFPGPFYDNDFGTPPGNCPYKYGTKQSISGWSGVGGVTCWDGNATHGWGPGAPTGYTGFYNAAFGVAGSGCDGNRYFYDPNAMPSPYSGGAYAPFTDMVVNLVNLSFPLSQPITQPTTFAAANGFNYTFPSSTFSVFFAEGSGANASYNYEYDSQLQGKMFKFTNIAYLVEASRGNLDLDNNNNYTNFSMSYLGLHGTDKNGLVLPGKNDCQVGYQKAYQRLAMYVSQPFATAQAGAFKFFQNLAQTSGAYFGFVGFSASPANYTGNPDNCAYLINESFPTSLFYNCSGTPNTASPTYADFFYHGSVGVAGVTPNINPNVWMWSPMIVSSATGNPPSDGLAGPAATPTGIPYYAGLNNSGPGNPGGTAAPTWLKVTFGNNAGSPPASSTISWAFTNLGFQIPRDFLIASSSDTSTSTIQQQTFNGVCSNETMSIFSITGTSPQGVNTAASTSGYNGLFHCRPLTDTDALEALETALANLGVSVNSSAGVTGYSFSALTGYGSGIKNARAGAINIIVFFTDGIPTDTVAGNGGGIIYSNYTSEVINPAQQNGIPIYSIGLALNPIIQSEQFTFLNTLTNNGANGSQFFQVTNASSLTGAFTGIAKQLTQCLR